jgi:arylformamidase
MMLTVDWRNKGAGFPSRLFQSAVAVSGLFDLEPLTLTYLNAALRLTREQALQASPIFRRNVADTPLLVVVGDQETPELLRQSRDFAVAWPQSEFLAALGMNHFSVIDAFHDPASPLFERVQRHIAAEFTR